MSLLIDKNYIRELPVSQDPDVVSGVPVFKGTRVPVSTMFEYLADDYTLDEFLESFPSVSRNDAVKVIMFGQVAIHQAFSS